MKQIKLKRLMVKPEENQINELLDSTVNVDYATKVLNGMSQNISDSSPIKAKGGSYENI